MGQFFVKAPQTFSSPGGVFSVCASKDLFNFSKKEKEISVHKRKLFIGCLKNHFGHALKVVELWKQSPRSQNPSKDDRSRPKPEMKRVPENIDS